MTPENFFDLVGYAWGCDDCQKHPNPFNKDDVSEVLHFAGRCSCGAPGLNEEYETCESYCDSSSFAVLKLKDGRFATFWESSDSTGHG